MAEVLFQAAAQFWRSVDTQVGLVQASYWPLLFESARDPGGSMPLRYLIATSRPTSPTSASEKAIVFDVPSVTLAMEYEVRCAKIPVLVAFQGLVVVPREPK